MKRGADIFLGSEIKLKYVHTPGHVKAGKSGYRSIPIIDKLFNELVTYLETSNNDILFPMLNDKVKLS